MWKVGVSSKANEITEALIGDYAEAGVAAMEVTPHWERYDEFDYANARRLADRFGVELWSYHLQFWPGVDIASLDPEFRKRSVERLAGQIKAAADIGIDKLVVHPCTGAIGDEERAGKMKASKESLSILADEAERGGAILCVEDLPRTNLGHNSAEIKELLSADGRLRVCFDTNHLVGETGDDFVRALGEKIVTLHVSDYDFVDERHWMPGVGKVDWNALIGALSDVGYNGVWMYEIDFTTRAEREEGEYSVFDFAANAKELFEAAKG